MKRKQTKRVRCWMVKVGCLTAFQTQKTEAIELLGNYDGFIAPGYFVPDAPKVKPKRKGGKR